MKATMDGGTSQHLLFKQLIARQNRKVKFHLYNWLDIAQLLP
jgi:hypothetical protein